MAEFKVELPKMGESVAEATITTWLKSVGDQIEEDEPIVEIATDKVDSEVPSPCSGILKEALFKEGDVVQVGAVFAVIESDQNVGAEIVEEKEELSEMEIESEILKPLEKEEISDIKLESTSERFYSPLVKSIAKKESISQDELDKIKHHTGTPWSITIRSRVFNSMEASGLLYKIEDRELMDKVLKLYQESYQGYKFIGDYDNTHIHKMDDILLSRFTY